MIPQTLAGLSYILTIITTLRAGSRVLYLLQHGGKIGCIDGPLILGPSQINNSTFPWEKAENETKRTKKDISPLWEVVHAFEAAVRLSISTDDFPSVMVTDISNTTSASRNSVLEMASKGGEILSSIFVFESEVPYSLSPYPHPLQYKNYINVSSNNQTVSQSKGNQSFNFTNQNESHYQPLSKVSSRIRKECDIMKTESCPNHDFSFAISTTVPIPTNTNQRRMAHVTTYAPQTFEQLRKRYFGIREQQFLQSMTGPFVSFFSTSKGAARAGGFFFFSRDGAYLVKTVKKSEAQQLLTMLPRYYHYMKQHARRSLLTRFFGLYRVSIRDDDEVSSNSKGLFSSSQTEEHFFLIMNSVFPPDGSKFISEMFDLKGSTVGRECSREERRKKGRNAILKDLDLAKETMSVAAAHQPRRSYGLNIGARAKASLLSQLRRDVRLLMECGVMDYSLLVGIVHMENDDSASPSFGDVCEYLPKPKSETTRRGFRLLSTITFPFRVLFAPPFYLIPKSLSMITVTLSKVLTLPFPYYGAGKCGVDGGVFSMLHGRRHGKRAVYYLGIIDFLYPWGVRKVLEREMKGMLGFDKTMISCVHPREYAERFVNFIDANVT